MAPTAATTKTTPRKTTSKVSAPKAPAEPKTGAELVQEYAERAVLIPVGAALTARDNVVETVTDLIDTYSSPKKAEAQLKRFERRGVTARNRFERNAKKTRTRVERELRRRRKELERGLTRFEKRRDEAAKRVEVRLEEVSKQVETTVEKVTDATQEFVSKVQERVQTS